MLIDEFIKTGISNTDFKTNLHFSIKYYIFYLICQKSNDTILYNLNKKINNVNFNYSVKLIET